MSNFDSSILLQEFNLKYASEDDLTESDEEVFELDSNFDQFTNDENEGPISQKYNALSLGTWQIDQDAVQQVNNDHLKLGVCDSHFLYDQNQIHDPKEKVLVTEQYIVMH